MGLVLEWENLGTVLLPFLVSLTVAALLALPLRRAMETRRAVRGPRSPGAGATPGPDPAGAASPPEFEIAANVALVLFVATAATACFAFSAPSAFARYVLPLGLSGPGIAGLVAAAAVGANASAAVLLAAFLVQHDRRYETEFARAATLAALAGLLAIVSGAGGLVRWADLAVPLSLLALLFVAGTRWRARTGGSALGPSAVGMAALPLLGMSLLGLVRIAQILELARS